MIHILIIVLIIIGLFIVILHETKKWFELSIGTGVIFFCGNMFFLLLVSYASIRPLVVIDNDNKIVDGVIQGVERNVGGTYTLHFKTDKRETYCMENKEILEFARKNVGKHVIIGKGKREGIYTFDKCNEAPVTHIERFEDVQSND